MRILLLEDEKALADGLRINLQHEGYEIVIAQTGLEALQYAENQKFDLAILDVMVPEMNGFDVAEKIKLMHEKLPFIFLTAKDQPTDIVKGLKIGAEDYISKPFHLEELLLRVKKALKINHAKGVEEESYQIGDCTINFKTYSAETLKGEVQLTKKEALLLKLLVTNKDQAISRKEILAKVWDYEVYPSTRTIDNFILSFRRYFEKNPKKPKHFKSIRGVGYMFTD